MIAAGVVLALLVVGLCIALVPALGLRGACWVGAHEWVHERDRLGWHLRCCRCQRMSAGIAAFRRP